MLKRLNDAGVEFVLVGGMAAVAHGSSVVTSDLDVCAPLGQPNLSKILDALHEIRPKLRMRPDRMPLPEDFGKTTGLKNLNLQTDLGIIDFLGDLEGVGSFEEVVKHSERRDVGGVICNVLDLDTLIIAKRAAGRRKDLHAVVFLEAIRKRLQQQPGLFDKPNNPTE